MKISAIYLVCYLFGIICILMIVLPIIAFFIMGLALGPVTGGMGIKITPLLNVYFYIGGLIILALISCLIRSIYIRLMVFTLLPFIYLSMNNKTDIYSICRKSFLDIFKEKGFLKSCFKHWLIIYIALTILLTPLYKNFFNALVYALFTAPILTAPIFILNASYDKLYRKKTGYEDFVS